MEQVTILLSQFLFDATGSAVSTSIYSQLIASGLMLGVFYSIVALGLALIFGVMKILNLAHGQFIILGAYISYWFFALFGIDPLISIALATAIAFTIGSGLHASLFGKLSKMGFDQPIVASFGLLLILQGLFSIFFSANVRGISSSYGNIIFQTVFVSVSLARLIVVIAGIGAVVVLFVFLKSTYIGKAIRGSSENRKAAAFSGINVNKIDRLSFALGIGVAGFAGVLLSLLFGFDPTSGTRLLLKALAVIVLAGTQNMFGLLLAGVILGVAESVGSFVIGGGFADAISYGIFLIVLLVRPSGLLGRKEI